MNIRQIVMLAVAVGFSGSALALDTGAVVGGAIGGGAGAAIGSEIGGKNGAIIGGAIGGGIGQARTYMYLLHTAHLGEVTVTVWPQILKKICAEKNIHVLE